MDDVQHQSSVSIFTRIDRILQALSFQNEFSVDRHPTRWWLLALFYFIPVYAGFPLLFRYVTSSAAQDYAYPVLMFAVAIVVIILRRKRHPFVGLAIPNPKNFLFTCLACIVIPHGTVFLVATIVAMFMPNAQFTIAEIAGKGFWLQLIPIVIIAPITEELFFRGILYPAMRRRFSLVIASYINGLLFAFAHITIPFFDIITGIFSFEVGIPIGPFLLGWFCCYLFERCGSIWVLIFLHASLNLTGPLVMLFCPFMRDFLKYLF